MQPSRQFPIEPLNPKRNLNLEPPGGPVLGLGTKGMSTEKFLDPKPILRTYAPQCLQYRAARDRREGCKLSKAEDMPAKCRTFYTKYGKMDPPRSCYLRFCRLENNVQTSIRRIRLVRTKWQRAVLWDCVQTRPSTNEKAQQKLRRRKKSASHRSIKHEGGVPAITSRVRRLSNADDLAKVYVRQCPGMQDLFHEPSPSAMSRSFPKTRNDQHHAGILQRISEERVPSPAVLQESSVCYPSHPYIPLQPIQQEEEEDLVYSGLE
ncbi:hypothetical protein ScPMuIL_000976 [Solemya velum]